MQIICEGHPQVRGATQGLEQVLHRPTVSAEPVLQGESDVDLAGASIYGSVIRDGGIYRIWYQAWPRDWDGKDVVAVACAESSDGLTWRRPSYNLVEACGSRSNHLTDLPFHSPSVFIDPEGDARKRYRAFGYTTPQKVQGRYAQPVEAAGYYSAYSADGLHWELESPRPLWPHADVITAVWDPYLHRARIAWKRVGSAAGMHRRRFYTAEWSQGWATEPVSALFPDELDDLNARARGYVSADYYGVGLMPTPGPTIGFLWNFRHQQPLGHSQDGTLHYGSIGTVDLSLVYQLERGGRWLHLLGRPDWLRAAEAPSWAQGALYTAAAPIQVGEESWLYFTGTQERHGWYGDGVDGLSWRRSQMGGGGFARIGLLRWPRHRLIGLRARLPERIELTAAEGGDPAGRLLLNATCAAGGHLRVALRTAQGDPIPGYGFEECQPITADGLAMPVTWRDQVGLPRLEGAAPLVAQVALERATLYAFDFTAPA